MEEIIFSHVLTFFAGCYMMWIVEKTIDWYNGRKNKKSVELVGEANDEPDWELEHYSDAWNRRNE